MAIGRTSHRQTRDKDLGAGGRFDARPPGARNDTLLSADFGNLISRTVRPDGREKLARRIRSSQVFPVCENPRRPT